ncbi:hypothetical protein [Paenibacillus turpanensis]|uniref:hypothetical protein n=1 Tax=Paenibacillus turpanensis TaxID=2689078 RepID=UPI00140D5A18|nr:hypothetical protein [Paenibacillus turpanensis]
MNRNFSLGVLILVLGFFILLGKLGLFSFLGAMLWPAFVLIPGLILHFLYFSKVLPSGVLIPAGILTTYSFLFFFCNIFGGHLYKYLWPVFILGVAIGLYEFYLFDRSHPRGVFIASAILAGIALVCFSIVLLFSSAVYLIALGLIAFGFFLIYRRPKAW